MRHPAPVVALMFAAFALWQVVDHFVLMAVPMGMRHLLSTGVPTAIAFLLTCLAVRTISTQFRECRTLTRLKDDLTHMVVHDMKNPLTAVLGYADLMATETDSALSPRGQEWLRNIRVAGEQLLSMANNLLDITRLEEGKLALQHQPLSLEDLVRRSVAEVQHQAEQKAVRLIAESHGPIPLIQGDPDLLGRVITNLLSNAIRYSPKGEAVEVSQGVMDSGEVTVSVQDRGPGIPRPMHKRVFEKFAQVEDREHRIPGTSGLGLAFCKMAVEAHGGRMGLESEPDSGARFFFVLPAAEGSN